MNTYRDAAGKLLTGPYVYFDRENSSLCPTCARRSDNPEEVPQFRPKRGEPAGKEDSCDQCSKRFTGNRWRS